MARINEVMEILYQLEYSNDPKKALHRNAGEDGLTYKGIYQKANSNWAGWKIIEKTLEFYNGD